MGNYEANKDYTTMADYFGEYYDLETGEPYIPTQAHIDARARLHERMKKFINPDGLRKGTIVIVSTMADGENGNDYKNIWNDSGSSDGGSSSD